MSPNYLLANLSREQAEAIMEEPNRCWSVVGENTAPGFVWWDAVTGDIMENPESDNPIHYSRVGRPT